MTVDGTCSIDVEDPSLPSLSSSSSPQPLRHRTLQKRSSPTPSSLLTKKNQQQQLHHTRQQSRQTRRRRRRKRNATEQILMLSFMGFLFFVVILMLVWFFSSLYTTNTTITTTVNDDNNNADKLSAFNENAQGVHLALNNSSSSIILDQKQPEIGYFNITSSKLPITHILHTRFMQHQPNLHHLSQSRFLLFKTICYKTVSAQSTSNFIWIIRTDPNLDASVKKDMIQLLKPHPNFFLVGSNTNFMTEEERGGWRGGAIGRDLINLHQNNMIYTGDFRLLQEAMHEEEKRIVLETRLDADDGIDKLYLEYVQWNAVKVFSSPGVEENKESDGGVVEQNNKKKKNKIQTWMYWCHKTNIEWHLSTSSTIENNNDREKNKHHPGFLKHDTHTNFCVTPGLTVGFAPFVNVMDVPVYSHDVLVKKIKENGDDCNSEKGSKGCVELLEVVAIRSRAATSAGMMGLGTAENQQPNNKKYQNQLWQLTTSHFQIKESTMKETNNYMIEHMVEIARDNMEGQCTDGHSCKVSSLETLQRFMDLELEASHLVNPK